MLCSAYEKPIVVVIASHNNATWCEKNLSSVYMQHYTNYRVVYIDDNSTDDTPLLARMYTATAGQTDKFTLISNLKRKYALANYYEALHQCRDDEIAVCLDGDDCFAHDQVLARINEAYADDQVWCTYGSYAEHPSGALGICAPLPAYVVSLHAYRQYTWVTSHLRTFYAWLGKRIRLQDLLDKGLFFKQACDQALMLPILEMASGHVHFIPDILYLYNMMTGANVHAIRWAQQVQSLHRIRSQQPYARLESQPQVSQPCNAVDVLLFSYNQPERCSAVVQSVIDYVGDVRFITVIVQASEAHRAAYQQLGDVCSKVQVIDAATSVRARLAVMQVLQDKACPYVLLMSDEMCIDTPIAIPTITGFLDSTKAYGFFLALGKETIPPVHIELQGAIWAWQFGNAARPWRDHLSLSAALYPKQHVLRDFFNANYATQATLKDSLNSGIFDWQAVGLCYPTAHAKMVC